MVLNRQPQGGRSIRLIFDIETNGLLDELDRLHCLCLRDIDTGHTWSCTDHPYETPNPDTTVTSIEEGLKLLSAADLIIGHNVIKFDIPAIRKVYPRWTYRGIVRDTLVTTRLIWPKDPLREKDLKLWKREKLPGNMIGRYSLQA